MRSSFEGDSLCRICSSLEDEVVEIFSEEGKRLNLQEKILKYLYIEVLEDDGLPDCACAACTRRLEDVHHFAQQALGAQRRLRGLLPGSSPHPTESQEGADTDLTEEETVQVEVRVDPTSFLPCMEAGTTSPEPGVPEQQVSVELVREEGLVFRLTCHACSELQLYNSLAQLQAHCRGVHGVQRGAAHAQCIICGRTVTRIGRLAAHARQHGVTVHPYRCEVCGQGFGTRILLRKHRRMASHSPRVHPSSPPSRSTTQKLYEVLQRHFELSAASTYYECPLCGKFMSTKGNLKAHLETHRPKGKYGCNICGRVFGSPNSLSRHVEYHVGGQFACGECGRVYPSKSTLRAHGVTHSNLRPHACSCCDKTFKRNQDLKFHMNQHTGARPYRCPYCPKAFASSGNCFSHRKRMHAPEVQRDRTLSLQLLQDR